MRMLPDLACLNMASFADENESFLASFCDFADGIDVDELREGKRNVCDKCRRPLSVCWCPFLPSCPLEICTNIYILQHPFEESRNLRTVPMLMRSVIEEKVFVFRGKRFSTSKYPSLEEVFSSPKTLLLYPGSDAIDLSDVTATQRYPRSQPCLRNGCSGGCGFNVVILDGTWAQARGMYYQNEVLQRLRKAQIHYREKSKYVIRTQPTDIALSTLETAAVAISVLENRPEIVEVLTRPLVALCDFQLCRGAVKHHSREFKIEHGLWTKPLPRSLQRRCLERCQDPCTNDCTNNRKEKFL